ncbi:VOC family protein [Antrihabitans cavernicola]|uniref:VOC family protein n=1 Tax=Antrihabitans cavernicola TaxID=2495913 RepID=A0A5A7SBP6_9NOCA|nr:VOC family protein [Spelaeibacter cavernicola]KAA0022013.1 VOC family protein [Spelaeibacter cavernicola]
MFEPAALMGFVGVSDLARANEFYGAVLGLDLRDESPFALVAEIGGAMLRITAVETPAAAPYTVLGWRVDDIEAAIDDLVTRGVEFSRYDGMVQDERGIWTTPDGTKVAWFLDPDRNNLSLTQFP